MFGHPAFVARHVRSDAQRETFFAEQGIAAVARAVGPDLAGFREMNDVFFLIAGPHRIFLAGLKRRADAMHARHDAFLVLVDFPEHREADARHDAHVDDDVRRIGQLHADLRHGRAYWPHAESQHVHGAPAHTAVEKFLQLLAHFVGVDPVVGGSRAVFGKRADKRAILDARDVARVRTGVKAAGPEFLIEFDERAALHHLSGQPVVFFLRTVDPVNLVRLGKRGNLVDPVHKVGVLAQGLSLLLGCHLHPFIFPRHRPAPAAARYLENCAKLPAKFALSAGRVPCLLPCSHPPERPIRR